MLGCDQQQSSLTVELELKTIAFAGNSLSVMQHQLSTATGQMHIQTSGLKGARYSSCLTAKHPVKGLRRSTDLPLGTSFVIPLCYR